jgi:hypothetical protein
MGQTWYNDQNNDNCSHEDIERIYRDVLVEIQGLKPWTSALPALRSNQLSYIPMTICFATD